MELGSTAGDTMAGNTVNVNLSVQDQQGTIKRRTDEARALNSELERSKQLAAGGAGTRAMAAQNIEYGRARGTMGGTGASARDFANEAQGLGGLVRLYATVAANTFAAAAAFNTLKEAADTTALREGLNQLGASSGIALGSLAKSFVQATDGAVSFREAASAASKATSAGLTSRQFLEIGEYAKKASQALGIDMSDAVSRLTRGIVKLEPELLDELGIFTKIGPAVEEYARKLGKTEGSLTDFERRQAFAIAVLDEAKKKYAEITIPTNPYQQLLATLKDVTQAGLELLNKFLLPVVSVFANNSALVVAAIVAIGAKLIGMAVPALSGWSKGLKDSADRAKEYASAVNIAFGENLVDKINKSFGVPDLKKNLTSAEQAFKQSQANLTTIQAEAGAKRKSLAYKEQDVTRIAADPEYAKRLSRSIQTEIRNLTAIGSDPSVSPETTKRAQDSIKQLELRKQAIQDITKYTKQLGTATASATQAAEKQGQSLGELTRATISKRAAARAERLDILSGVTTTVDKEGFKAAIDEINKKLSDSKTIGAFGKFRTLATGTFIAATASVGNFLQAFGPWGQVLGIGTGLLAILDNYFSKATKQMEAFTKELEINQETIDNSTNVIKKYKNELVSTEAISAYGTSIGELADGVSNLSKKFTDLIEKQSPWEQFKQGILSFFGASAAQDFAETVSQNWMKQIEVLPEGELKSAAILKLKNIFNITDITSKSLKQAIEQSDNLSKAVKVGQEALQPAVSQTRQLGVQAQTTKDSIEKLSKSSQDLQNSFVDQSPLAKFAQDLIKAAGEIQKSFTNMSTAIAAFKEILAKPGAFALIDNKDLMAYKEAVASQEKLVSLQAKRGNLLENLNKAQTEEVSALAKSNGRYILPESPQALLPGARTFKEAGRAIAARQKIEEQLKQADSEIEKLILSGSQDLFKSIRETLTKSILKGFELLQSSRDIAREQALVQTRRGIISGVTGPGMAEVNFNLSEQDIALQKRQLDIQGQLVDQLQLNTMAQIEANNLKERSDLEDKMRRDYGADLQVDPKDLQRLAEIQQSLQELTILKTGITTGGQTPSGAEISKFRPETAAVALNMTMTRMGREAKEFELTQRLQLANFDRQTNVLKEQVLIQTDSANNELKQIQYRQQILGLGLVNIDYLNQEQLLRVQGLETQKLQQEQLIQTLSSRAQIAEYQLKLNQAYTLTDGMENEITQGLRTRLQYAKTLLGITEQQQEQDKKILQIQQQQQIIAVQFIKYAEERKFNLLIQEKATQLQEAELQLNQQILEVVNSRGVLTQQEYDSRKRANDITSLELDTTSRLRDIESKRIEDLQRLEEARAKAAAAAIVNEGDTTSAENFKRISEQEKEINRRADIEIQALRRVQEFRRQGIALQNVETDRQKNYADAFKNAFSGMADALVNWAKTGKLAGKELFDSLIADLLRYELRLQMTQLYGLARPAIVEGVAAIFGGSTATPMVGQQVADSFAVPVKRAMGGAYNRGIETFGRGGMFTNSIVTDPTLFKFARGTGLMGEAGPEAIMPLKRDNQGNLGVSGGGTNVEVVINNTTGQPATARQSTDSRGNRKIEVVVGDMVAGELSRTGSGPQTAMRNMFNVQPRLTRR